MHPNAEVVMKAFQAFAEGDMAGMKELIADDAVWHGGGRNKWSGDYTGVDAILRLMTGIRDEATFETRPHAILADDEHVVALIESTATRPGKTYEGQSVFIFHVDDGKMTESWSIPMDSYAVDEFWTD